MRWKIGLLSALALLVVGVLPLAAPAAPPSPQAPNLLARHASPPSVVGLNLVVAEDRLRSAGWAPRPFNTDTLFGIVVPSHYTVCHQYRPIGKKVRLLAQKYGC